MRDDREEKEVFMGGSNIIDREGLCDDEMMRCWSMLERDTTPMSRNLVWVATMMECIILLYTMNGSPPL